MTTSKIEWTDRSDWNPVRGCTRVSEGCRHCYAEAIAARFSAPGQPFHGFAEMIPPRHGEGDRAKRGGVVPRWTGKVELVEDRLTLPLRWRKPALRADGTRANKVFASSTSDIFHESLSDAEIDRIFAVMALAPGWTFQVLTKRSARMRAWFERRMKNPGYETFAHARDFVGDQMFNDHREGHPLIWPLPNVWLGVSVEDQARKGRIDDLRDTPAAVRFLSLEPLLEDLGDVDLTGIDWVIAGGESGPRARPMHPDWARSLRDQCAAAGVAFHFKQWGEWHAVPIVSGMTLPSGGVPIARVGKKRAGRLLDGVTHDEFPGSAGPING